MGVVVYEETRIKRDMKGSELDYGLCERGFAIADISALIIPSKGNLLHSCIDKVL